MLFANDRMKLVTLISSDSLRWKTGCNSVTTHNLVTYILYSLRLSTDEFLRQIRFIVSLDFHIFLLKNQRHPICDILRKESHVWIYQFNHILHSHTKARRILPGTKIFLRYIPKDSEESRKQEKKWNEMKENKRKPEKSYISVESSYFSKSSYSIQIFPREIYQNLPLTNHRQGNKTKQNKERTKKKKRRRKWKSLRHMLAHISYRPKLLSTCNENSHQTSTENYIE